MRKIAKYFALLAAILSLPFFALAQSSSAANIESLTSFDSKIYVNTDNSIRVIETILYNSGPTTRHGLLRDIYPYSSEKRKMDINVVSIKDENGQLYPWKEERSGSYVRLRIGDPKTTWRGQQTYIISYTATNAVAHPKDIDEIYWNVTGSNWEIPIISASASIYLPQGLSATQSSCYFGDTGSNNRCDDPNGIATAFASSRTLAPKEGMTVAVGFPKGVIANYSVEDNVSNRFGDTAIIFFAILLPVSVFIYMFLRWKKYGRDPKGRGTIIPEYDVPDGLSPLEVSAILNQYIRPKDISSEVINLAVRGYLKIRQTENKVLGIFKSTDYEFVLLKSFSENDLPKADVALLDSLIGSRSVGATKKMSDLKNVFYKNISEISDHVVDVMLEKGYYSNLNKNISKGVIISSVMLVFAFSSAFIFGRFMSIWNGSNLLVLGLSVLFSAIIFAIFTKLMPAKTEKGVQTKEYILGLKDYLQIAEKDRLAFHNAPEKKPEIFEKLLPFAMVLGVDKAWAKEFSDIYITPPNWYETTHANTFNAIIFNKALSDFSAATNTNLTAAPGGSSGAGSVGGGGGGGGGGGW